MSRTKESTIQTSPVTAHYFLNMKTGKFSCLKEGEKDFLDVKLPFHFILLDAGAFRAAGKNMKTQRKIKSTMGHFVLNPSIKVFYEDTKEVIAEGSWRSIKDVVGEKSGRFVSVLFAATPAGEMVCIHLKGRAYSEWLKYLDENGAKGKDPASFFADSFFSVTGTKSVSGDMGESYVPTFTHAKISKDETVKMADELDFQLQCYFKTLFGEMQATPERGPSTDEPGFFPNEEPPAKDDGEDNDPLPF